jgi:hypothetical protein
MLMADFWRFNNGGATAMTGCRKFVSGVQAMTVLGRLRFFGSGTLVVHITAEAIAHIKFKLHMVGLRYTPSPKGAHPQ